MTTWWRRSPDISGREIVLAALGAALLFVALFWPLPLHLGRDIPLDTGDPLSQAWQVAWDGHALTAQPLHLFQANQFWPLRNTLAFSDALLGYAPAGLIGSGPHAAVVRYDLLFLFAGALALLGDVPARTRAGRPALGGRDRRRGVRLRALAARAGRPPARALERRDPARAVPAPAGLPPRAHGSDPLRLGRVRVAVLTGLHARPPARLPAGRARGARRRLVVACGPSAAGAAPGRRDRGRRRPASPCSPSCWRARTCRCSTIIRRHGAPRRSSPGTQDRRGCSWPRRTPTSSGAARRPRCATGSRSSRRRRCSRALRSSRWRSPAWAGGASRGRCASGSAWRRWRSRSCRSASSCTGSAASCRIACSTRSFPAGRASAFRDACTR